MKCNNCGTTLNGNEKYCFNCGFMVDKVQNVPSNNPSNNVVSSEVNGKKTASIVLGIVSLVGVFLFIFAPISLVLSIIGLIFGIKAKKEINNVAGIVINAIGLFLSFIVTLIIVFIIYIFVNLGNNFDFGKIPWNDYITEYGDKF